MRGKSHGLFGHLVTIFIRGVFRLLCRIRVEGMEKVPSSGPFILVLNHINFLDVPVVYTVMYPRLTSSLVKAETWENPILGRLGNLWNGIPLKREGTDFSALRTAEERMKNGHILMVAPEGTRSYDGKLGHGNPGVVSLALHAGVPFLPMAHYGGESFWENLKHLKRTPLTLRFGDPFRIEVPGSRVNARIRREIINEIMEKIACLLPEYYRGIYSGDDGRSWVFLKTAGPKNG